MLSLGTFPQDNIPPPIPREAENPHNLEPDLDPVLKVMLGLFFFFFHAGSFYSAVGRLSDPCSPRTCCLPLWAGLHILTQNPLSKQPGLGRGWEGDTSQSLGVPREYR